MVQRKRIPDGPTNTSLGAGPAAPASAAARAPMEGAHGGEPGSGFYSPETAEAPAASGLEGAAAAQFTETVRQHHTVLESGGTADREVVERAAAEEITDDEDLAAVIERLRKIRKPLAAFAQKLALPPIQGYHLHWFNDVAGRIEEAKANGWAHVSDKDGKTISRCVGSGRDKGALYAFAMKIPAVFWDEDQDAKHQVATQRIDALKATPFRAEPGTAQASDKGKFYDPSDSGAPIQVVKS